MGMNLLELTDEVNINWRDVSKSVRVTCQLVSLMLLASVVCVRPMISRPRRRRFAVCSQGPNEHQPSAVCIGLALQILATVVKRYAAII